MASRGWYLATRREGAEGQGWESVVTVYSETRPGRENAEEWAKSAPGASEPGGWQACLRVSARNCLHDPTTLYKCAHSRNIIPPTFL